MQCQNCGSESGFRGVQPVTERVRGDGLIERLNDGPERIHCKKCGAQVVEGQAAPSRGEESGISVLSGVPSHLQGDFDLPEGTSEDES